jgi:tyrosyl-tRNA synthetase
VLTGATEPLVVDLIAEGLGLSRSEVRRAVKDGGAYVNNRRVDDERAVLTAGDWLHGRFAVLRRGKRSVAVAERTG